MTTSGWKVVVETANDRLLLFYITLSVYLIMKII